MTPAPLPTKRLLIVKFGAIGDCIMAVPGAFAMHQAGYAVDWVCGRAVAPVLALYPWLRLHVVDERTLLQGGKAARLRAIAGLWSRLRRQRYETIATLYFDRRYRLLTLPLRAPRKFLLSKTDRATALLPGRHHTDEYARILLGRADDATPRQLAPVPVALPQAPAALSDPPAGRQRVVLVPGGARNLLRDDALRRWPLASYVAVAENLLTRGYEVVLAGGPDDTWTSPAFAPLVAVHALCRDTIGTLTLPETLALFDSAALTVTHDTGPLHLAGITRASVLAIFGPTDPRGRLPQRSNCVALWGGEGFACRPCYDGRDYAPCSRNLCVEQVTPAMVVTEAEALLDAVRQARELLPRVRTPKHTPLEPAVLTLLHVSKTPEDPV